ncbi:hypothetical protein G6M81_15980 [Agrobacterium tumefaciens]|nr:hypothetical protein [Agrobacterium tumefaciens]NTD11670.1 hypothetical protein [Agrobacterium tumefaciens]
MSCPRCQTGLLMGERQGIEIDYCPSCRGVWLDQGELDKVIERSFPNMVAVAAARGQPWGTPPDPVYRDSGHQDGGQGGHERYDDHGYQNKDRGHGSHHRGRHRSIFSKIFD